MDTPVEEESQRAGAGGGGKLDEAFHLWYHEESGQQWEEWAMNNKGHVITITLNSWMWTVETGWKRRRDMMMG